MADARNQPPNTTLADAARGDGLHDFGDLGPILSDTRNAAFVASVTGNSLNNWTNEDNVFNAVFNNPGVNGGEVNVRTTLATLTADGQKTRAFTTLTGYPYTIKRVQFIGEVGGAKTGKQLADDLGLNNSVLQIDFNHHGFLARLKSGPSAPETRVGYIWSAATLNDPASKTPPDDNLFSTTNGSGIALIAYQQTSGTTLFPRGYYDRALPTRNFVSNYDVELSGITKKVSLGRRTKDMVTLKFTSGAQSATISDSKGQNSPGYLSAFLTKLLGKVRTPQDDFSLASKWQQKRSGDWLQVLHAALLKTMTFNPDLPAVFHTFFVSHDRIAIAYALAMGVPCLYFSGDSIFVFDNREENPEAARAACQASLAAIPPVERTAMKNWFFGSDSGGRHSNGIDDTRNDLIRGYKTTIQESCALLLDPSSMRTLGDIEKAIQAILKSAMRATFLETALPDAETLRRETDSPDPCVQFKGYATLQALYKQHGGNVLNTGIPGQFFTQFERTMAFTTLSKWSIDPATTVVSRITSFVKGAEAEPRDAFTFFPFIQNSKDAVMKQRIATTFQAALANVTDAYLGAKGAKPRRIERVKLTLSTLYKQGYVYLQTTPVTEAEIRGGLAEEFTNIAALPKATAEGVSSVNQMTVDQIVLSKGSKLTVSDLPGAAMGDEWAVQVGGWDQNARPLPGTDIDFSQCADPLLYAVIEYYTAMDDRSIDIKKMRASTTQAEDALTRTEAREVQGGGKRRPLYGGVQTQTMTMTSEEPVTNDGSIQRAETVRDMFVLLVAHQLANADSYKLVDAPPDVMDYYTKFWRLVLALMKEPPSWELARAVYAMFSHASYMTSADFQNAFGMNELDAATLRLTCAASEAYRLLEPPTEPAKDLLAAKQTLTKVWASIPKTTLETPESIRNSAGAAIKEIVKRYTGKELKFQGPGIPLQPGVEAPQTPEALRAARVAAFTKTAGRKRKSKRRTQRRSPTTP